MPTFDAVDLNTRSILGDGPYGNVSGDSAKIVTTQFTNGDILRLCRIPAGTRVDAILIGNDDLDSNGAPTAANKLGYTPVNSADGPAAVDNYWAAAGQTWMQAAGTRVVMADPITFDYDVYLILTATASSATFAAGTIRALVLGERVGTK